MREQGIPLKDLRRGIVAFSTLGHHVQKFNCEAYNLISNGLADTLANLTLDECDEESAWMSYERQQFTYTLYFLGLMTLLENRLGSIAEDIYYAISPNEDPQALHAATKKSIKIFDPKKTDETQTVFLLDFLKTTLSTGNADGEVLANRLRALKCLRDLIVHPRSFLYRLEADGTLVQSPTKQHEFVRDVFPEVFDGNGKITITQQLVEQSIEDARNVVSRIVERCEYEYLYVLKAVRDSTPVRLCRYSLA